MLKVTALIIKRKKVNLNAANISSGTKITRIKYIKKVSVNPRGRALIKVSCKLPWRSI